jgi:phenylpropionate dioxygenase-like ring-hydroxylating dioxygenase large terminal subunit
VSTYVDLVHFQHKIFLQDRSILENQLPNRTAPVTEATKSAIKR